MIKYDIRSKDRLERVFARCHKDNRAALVGYMVAGDPNPKQSATILAALAAHVDIIEIGMPFSDPMADGKTIQHAAERALDAGTVWQDVLNITANIRQQYPELGIILMGYANMAYVHGYAEFAHDVAQAGADGVLLVDLPPEESNDIKPHLQKYGLHNIRLIAPTSSTERIKQIAADASGFLYYVSLTGITGSELINLNSVRQKVATINTITNLPVCVGFGIKTPQRAVELGLFADGVVVGSHFVSQITLYENDYSTLLRELKSQAALFQQELFTGRNS
ncbi:MAG: tryptophan synthase subunit alpha [Mariprofundales bacterium]